MFPASTYASRRTKLTEILKSQGQSGVLIFPGNGESGMNYRDNTYRFRQDSTFLYFFGSSVPDLGAIIDLDSGDSVLFADDPGIDLLVWTGPLPKAAELANASGVKKTFPFTNFAANIAKARDSGRNIHTLPPYRGEHELFLLRIFGKIPEPSIPFILAVAGLREVKESIEIAELERATRVTLAMHLAAMRMAHPGMKESAIAAKIAEMALAAGGDLAFPVISTVHGETLHNHYHGNTLESGRLMLVDAGAETDSGYAGDFTTTFPVDRKFTPIQRDVYGVVLDAHVKAAAAIKPGVPFKTVHFAAARTIIEGMKSLGLMKGDTGDALAAGAHTLFFPHGIGHLLGLDAHDMENLGETLIGYGDEKRSSDFGLKSLRLAKPVKEGFVVTVEPGIYFIPVLIDKFEAEGKFRDYIDYGKLGNFRNFGGIRIEEDYLVTVSGSRTLCPGKPRTTAEIEEERKYAFIT